MHTKNHGALKSSYPFRGRDRGCVNPRLSGIPQSDQIAERMMLSELLSDPAAAMASSLLGDGDPGLLQKIPGFTALLPQGGGDGEQAAAAEGAIG
jgi:hypothetical protein